MAEYKNRRPGGGDYLRGAPSGGAVPLRGDSAGADLSASAPWRPQPTVPSLPRLYSYVQNSAQPGDLDPPLVTLLAAPWNVQIQPIPNPRPRAFWAYVAAACCASSFVPPLAATPIPWAQGGPTAPQPRPVQADRQALGYVPALQATPIHWFQGGSLAPQPPRGRADQQSLAFVPPLPTAASIPWFQGGPPQSSRPPARLETHGPAQPPPAILTLLPALPSWYAHPPSAPRAPPAQSYPQFFAGPSPTTPATPIPWFQGGGPAPQPRAVQADRQSLAFVPALQVTTIPWAQGGGVGPQPPAARSIPQATAFVPALPTASSLAWFQGGPAARAPAIYSYAQNSAEPGDLDPPVVDTVDLLDGFHLGWIQPAPAHTYRRPRAYPQNIAAPIPAIVASNLGWLPHAPAAPYFRPRSYPQVQAGPVIDLLDLLPVLQTITRQPYRRPVISTPQVQAGPIPSISVVAIPWAQGGGLAQQPRPVQADRQSLAYVPPVQVVAIPWAQPGPAYLPRPSARSEPQATAFVPQAIAATPIPWFQPGGFAAQPRFVQATQQSLGFVAPLQPTAIPWAQSGGLAPQPRFVQAAQQSLGFSVPLPVPSGLPWIQGGGYAPKPPVPASNAQFFAAPAPTIPVVAIPWFQGGGLSAQPRFVQASQQSLAFVAPLQATAIPWAQPGGLSAQPRFVQAAQQALGFSVPLPVPSGLPWAQGGTTALRGPAPISYPQAFAGPTPTIPAPALGWLPVAPHAPYFRPKSYSQEFAAPVPVIPLGTVNQWTPTCPPGPYIRPWCYPQETAKPIDLIVELVAYLTQLCAQPPAAPHPALRYTYPYQFLAFPVNGVAFVSPNTPLLITRLEYDLINATHLEYDLIRIHRLPDPG